MPRVSGKNDEGIDWFSNTKAVLAVDKMIDAEREVYRIICGVDELTGM